jgi:hypothetical protein
VIVSLLLAILGCVTIAWGLGWGARPGRVLRTPTGDERHILYLTERLPRAAAPPPRPAPAAPPAPKIETPAERQAFRADVAEAVKAAPQYQDSGKVWIHQAYAELVKDPKYTGLTLDEFERLLVSDPVMRTRLGRADLIQAMNPADVAASNAEYRIGNRVVAEFNFIRVKPR